MKLKPRGQMSMNSSSTEPLYTITVFTATYNRAHTLYRVYESLDMQTYRDFEWVICDDGSVDGTQQLVNRWQQEAKFLIRYFKLEHAGKHFAYNRGVKEAQGEYFAEIDSDDALKPIALERAVHHWQQIPVEVRNEYFAVLFCCEDENGKRVGTPFPVDLIDYDYRTFNYSHTYRSEKWRCIRTVTLRQCPFPEDVKDSYVPESIVFCEIAKRYLARFSNEILRIYYQDVPSIMRQPVHPMRHLEGLCFAINYSLNNDMDFFQAKPFHFLRKAMNFGRFSMHYRVSLVRQCASLTGSLARLLWLSMLMPAFLFFCLDIIRGHTPEAARKAQRGCVV
jgi:glycosyltransferase involved in cell wall biosynthesis